MTASTSNTSPKMWKWDSYEQVKNFETQAFKKIATALLDKKNCCRRAMGPLLALSDAGLTTALAVTKIAEPLIKGLGNIFGSCSDDCSLLRGLGYVFLATPLVLVRTTAAVAITLAGLPITFLILSVWVAVNPDHFKNFGKSS